MAYASTRLCTEPVQLVPVYSSQNVSCIQSFRMSVICVFVLYVDNLCFVAVWLENGRDGTFGGRSDRTHA